MAMTDCQFVTIKIRGFARGRCASPDSAVILPTTLGRGSTGLGHGRGSSAMCSRMLIFTAVGFNGGRDVANVSGTLAGSQKNST